MQGGAEQLHIYQIKWEQTCSPVKGNMQVLLLLSTFLHYLAQGKIAIDSASVFPVT